MTFGIHLVKPKALKIFKIISIEGENFECFWRNKMNTPILGEGEGEEL
jgi:hypothetical protein